MLNLWMSMYPMWQTNPNFHFQSINWQMSFLLLLWRLSLSDAHEVNIYKMLSRNQYFTQQKSATEPERVDYWIPGDQSHPQGIWFAFQLFWHGSGVIHCVPLKVNRCRLNHVANLQQRATHCCSLPPFDMLLWCRGSLCQESKATKKHNIFPSLL